MKILYKNSAVSLLLICLACFNLIGQKESVFPSYSGIYPHLAYYNNEGECGTGAVVPWAGRLWVISYGPHLPFGSSDKLYEITPDLQRIIRPESVGGTPANRMIHKESNQLFIGPYAIDANRSVRTIPYAQAPGRYTGLARDLKDPQNKILIATMEEGFYELDVKTLSTKLLYQDGNVREKKKEDISNNFSGQLLPGAHGKGVYSGQGVMVYSNNGESGSQALKQFDIEAGVLAEWNGKDWKVIRRNQFVEVTGPGSINGNKNPDTDPIWATGWDHKSVILGVRDSGKWSFFRLPKASHSYDGAHGWNTEWPRIRDIGTVEKPDYLMTMHGLFWRFPQAFTSKNSSGIRARSAYLKVIGDFTRWNNGLVFGCDDAAKSEFLNKRTVKGGIEGPGQSNSNLWFTSLSKPDELGPKTAQGAVWLADNIQANSVSEAFLFTGWTKRVAWIHNDGPNNIKLTFETDVAGNGNWKPLKVVEVGSHQSKPIYFSTADKGEWIRVKNNLAGKITVNFNYTDDKIDLFSKDKIFSGLSSLNSGNHSGGLLYSLGNNRRALGVLSSQFNQNTPTENGYYELDSAMHLVKKNDPALATFIKEKLAIPKDVITVEESSVLIIDDSGRRWRLPKGDTRFTLNVQNAANRISREVVTERDLLNAHGTFYELPAENADGFAKIRPVSSHSLNIHDYTSYRGLLVMTGIDNNDVSNEHIITSKDGNAKVWVGAIDDLWKLGKPVGEGGPWSNDVVRNNIPSDPYLIGFYDKKNLTLSHKSNKPVTFTIQVDAIGHGPWMNFKQITVKPNEKVLYTFPASFQARWIRFSSNTDCTATALLSYK